MQFYNAYTMKTSSLSIILALMAARFAAASNSFAGANNYYIHTTSDDVQDAWVKQITDDGAKVVRLWATGGTGGCVKGSQTSSVADIESSIGQYQNDSLDKLDNLLVKLKNAGIKAIISPHNGNNLDSNFGTCDAYCQKWGSNGFYTNNDAKTAYDNRLKFILNYVSPNFGKKWSQLSEVIMAFDVQNEPFITQASLAANNDASDWLCGRAGHMKDLIGSSGVKIATGAVAGSHYDGHAYNLMAKAVQCSAVDIISMHSYLTATQWGEFIPSVLKNVNGKHLMIEEFGVGNKVSGANVAPSEFSGIVDLFDQNGVPWIYWQVTPAADETQSCSDSCCHSGPDGFEYGPGSTKGGITMQAAMGKANSADAAQDWTGYI